MTDGSIQKILGRIEASQDHHASLLKELSSEHRQLHSDNASLKAHMVDIERRVSRIEPEVDKTANTQNRIIGSRSQADETEVARRSWAAIIISLLAAGYAVLKDSFTGSG